jgi:hypothetical protein
VSTNVTKRRYVSEIQKKHSNLLKRKMRYIMKKSLFVLFLLPLAAFAKVEVTMLEGKNYNDLEISQISYSKSKEDFKRIIEKYLNKYLDKSGKSDFNVNITFKEVDMAGRMDVTSSMGGMRGKVRKIDDLDFASLEFSYVITKGQKTVKSGEQVLKDLGTSRTIKERTRRNTESLYYEVRLLKNWLDEVIVS